MLYVVLHSTLDTHQWLQNSSYDQCLDNAPQEGMLPPIVTTYSLSPSANTILALLRHSRDHADPNHIRMFLIGVLVGDNFLSAANEQGKLIKVVH